MSLTVAVIGAGASGLVAAKECLDLKLDVTIFERQSQLGGIWNGSGVWNSMEANLSRFTVSFSDFEWPRGTPLMPSNNQVQGYLSGYASRFNLNSHIKFNVQVVSLERNQDKLLDKEWIIEYESLETKNISKKSFDYVIIASGFFSKPVIPSFEGIDLFKGRVIHSKDYKSPTEFNDQDVLVVGAAFSGAEISADLSGSAKTVTNLVRRPYWILSKYLPYDLTKPETKVPIDLVFYKFKQLIEPSNSPAVYQRKNEYLAKLCPKQVKIDSIIGHPEYSEPPRVLISDTYLNDVCNERIRIEKSEIARFTADGVCFKSGRFMKCDAVILATGYKLDLDYLDAKVAQSIDYDPDDTLQPLILYKCTFCPSVDTIGFVGVYRGPYWGVMELQARWIAQVFAKKIKLKSIDSLDVKSLINEEVGLRQARPRPQYTHGDYVELSRSLAEEILEYPSGLDELRFKEPELFDRILNGPYLPIHLRLAGLDENKLEVLKSQSQEIEELFDMKLKN